MKAQLKEKGFNIINDESSLSECLVETKKPTDKILTGIGNRGFLAGIKYSDTQILIALTEKRTKNEIDNYVESFSEVNNG